MRLKQIAGKACAFIVFLVDATKLLSFVFGFDSHIDTILFDDKIFVETFDPLYARMSPVAAFCFISAGLSMLLINFETSRKRMPSHYLALSVAFFGLSSLLGYILTVKAFYGNLTYVSMAIHTGLSFIFISLSILFVTPDKGVMKELTKPFTGSIIARRLIPIAVLIPLILGLLRLYLQLNGIVSYEVGITILIMCTIIALLVFIYYNTLLLNQRDFDSKEAEEELSETNYFLNTVLENIPDMIFVKDAKELRFFRINKAGEELLGYSKTDLLGKNDYDFFPKEQADFFTTKDREVLNGNVPIDIPEEPIKTKNGDRWIHTKKIPVRDENGNPLYLLGIAEDITERKKVDEQLRQVNAELEKKIAEKIASEQMFSSLFYKSPVMKVITEIRTAKYIEVNKAFADFLELEREEMIGKTSLELDIIMYPEKRDEILEKLRRDGFVRDAEVQIIFRNGKISWVSSSTNKINLNGQDCYQTATVDITGRKLIEGKLLKLSQELEQKVLERTEELAKSEQRFRKLLENNFETIVLSDENFMPFYRSPSTDRITGWTTEERIKSGGVVVQTHPDDLDRLKNVLQQSLACPAKAIPISFRTRHKEGHYIWLEGFVTNMLHDESLKGIITNFRDVTERKVYELKIEQSEQKFRKLTENNHEIISLLDEKFIPFYRSPAASRFTGWEIEDSIKAGGVTELTHPDDKHILKNVMQQVLAAKGKPVPVCFRTRHKAGHYIWLEGFITNMLHDESLKGIISNLRDVTKRKQSEEEINKLTEELRQLLEHTQLSREEERKYIAREIHDELGQRLTALKIDVSMMRRKMPVIGTQNYFSDEINSFIKQIDQSIESVKRIATDLRPEILDHHGVIAAVKWQAHQFENITGVKCKVLCLPEDMNLESELATAVYRSVQEALTNIARHAQATSVSILIEQDAEKLLIEIKDNGKGINEEQIRNTKSIGLIGIREHVHLLNGTLFITGKPGKGTVVSVNIPALKHL